MTIFRLSAAGIAAIALLAVLVACAAPAPAADAEVVAALIVKPRVVTGDPATVLKPMRAALGQTAGIKYVRPLADDAHIVYLTAPAQRAEVPQLIERLRASGAFQYVDLDSMMKIR